MCPRIFLDRDGVRYRPMPLRERFRWWLISHAGRVLMSFWMKSCRWTILGEDGYRAIRRAGRPVIFLMWHGKIFAAPYFFRRRNCMPLVSPSRDGEYIARLMDGWGYKIIRGSGSHPMKTAWLEMTRELSSGGELMIVPDGPKGPDRKFKVGAVKLAAETGAALVPWSVTARPKKVFRSWDRFEMFYPFAGVAAVYGTPVEVAGDLTAEGFEAERRRLEDIMVAFDAEVDRIFDNSAENE
jgi:lysophospholipid acyltransferase (LPLAT)-like uncharacterized protein